MQLHFHQTMVARQRMSHPFFVGWRTHHQIMQIEISANQDLRQSRFKHNLSMQIKIKANQDLRKFRFKHNLSMQI